MSIPPPRSAERASGHESPAQATVKNGWGFGRFKRGRVATACLATAIGAVTAHSLWAWWPHAQARAVSWPAAAAQPSPVAALEIPRGWQPSEARLAELLRTEIVSQSLRYLAKRYVDPERIDPPRMFRAAIAAMSVQLDPLLIEERSNSVTLRIGEHRAAFDLSQLRDLPRLDRALNRAVRFTALHLPGESLRHHIEYVAINGLLDTLDPYSAMLNPEAWHEMKTHTGGQFGGLGIRILTRSGRLTLDSVIADSPASKAGLKANDVILQINGEDTLNMGVDDAVDRLRGKVGSSVKLLIARSDWPEPRSIKLTRAIIRLKSVQGRLLEGGVAYARVKNFQRGTSNELRRLLRGIRPPTGLRGVILDLRGNPGGLLDEAVKVCDLWLDGGPVVITLAGGDREREVRSATHQHTLRQVPLVVLISTRSASASEIVAGALRESNRAILVGERSWGKGTVQVPFEIGEGALKLTVAKYLLPGDLSIQDTGVTPDIPIEFIDVAATHVHLFTGGAQKRPRRHKKAAKADRPPRQSMQTMRLLLPKDQASGRGVFEHQEPVERARQLIEVAGAAQASRFLAKARDWLQRSGEEQQTLLTERLRARGVVWRSGPNPEQPELTLELIDKAQPMELKAGDEATVAVRLHNRGKLPVHRVHVFTVSQLASFDGVEQLVGQLQPGQSRLVRLKLKASKRHLGVTLPVTVVVGVDGKATPVTASVSVRVLEQARPRFSWRVQWGGSKAAKTALARQEHAELKVTLRNDGGGPAERVRVTLRSLAGKLMHVQQGRATVPRIPPGGSAEVVFAVRAQRGSDRGLPGLLTAKLDVVDRRLGVRRTGRVHLPWKGAVEAAAMSRRALEASSLGRWYAAPEIKARVTLLPGKACRASLNGKVLFRHTHPSARRVTVSVNEAKRNYLEVSSGEEAPLNLRLALDKTVNRITIRARIGRHQVQRRDLLMYCPRQQIDRGDQP